MLKNALDLVIAHPWVAWLLLALLALAIQLVVDAMLGDTAEYFNAARVFVAWREMLAGRDPLAVHFLAGQQGFGIFALPLASVILFVQPLIYGGLLLLAVRFLARFLS